MSRAYGSIWEIYDVGPRFSWLIYSFILSNRFILIRVAPDLEFVLRLLGINREYMLHRTQSTTGHHAHTLLPTVNMKSPIFLAVWFGWGETTELRRNPQTQEEHEQIHLNVKLRLQQNQWGMMLVRDNAYYCTTVLQSKTSKIEKKNNTLIFKRTLQFQGCSITSHCHHTVS